MAEKYVEQVNVKISHQMRVLLRIVSKYETLKMSELVRRWINERLNTYMRNPQFKRWLKFHKEEAEELGEIRP